MSSSLSSSKPSSSATLARLSGKKRARTYAIPKIAPRRKCLMLLNSDGDAVKIYDSIKLASKELKLDEETMSKRIVPSNADKNTGIILFRGLNFRIHYIGLDGHFEECAICNKPGRLVCCNGCPRAYHLREECLGQSLNTMPILEREEERDDCSTAQKHRRGSIESRNVETF